MHLSKALNPNLRQGYRTTSGGRSTQLSYTSKSKDALIENNSSKSHPVKYYLSKSLKVVDLKYT